MSDNTTVIILWVFFLILVYVVAIPLVIYSWYRYENYADAMPIHKRGRRMVRLLLACVLVELGIADTLGSILPVGYRLDWNESKLMVAKYVNSVIYAYCTYLFLYTIICRYWMTFYKINYVKHMKSSAWKRILDAERDNDFFVRYKNTLGNRLWIIYPLIIAYILTATIVMIMYLGSLWDWWSYTTAFLVDIMFFTLGVLATFAIWYGTPAFYDQFHIMEECKMFTLIFAVYCFVSYIISIVPLSYFWSNMIWAYTQIFVYTALALTATLFVVYKLDEDQTRGIRYSVVKDPRALEHSYSDIESGTQETKTLREFSDDRSPLIVCSDALTEVLISSHGFEMFMSHLCDEFSMECLLSCVEFTQFKEFILSDKDFVLHLLAEIAKSEASPDLYKANTLSVGSPVSSPRRSRVPRLDYSALITENQSEDQEHFNMANAILLEVNEDPYRALQSFHGYNLVMLPMPNNDPNNRVIPKSAIVHRQWTNNVDIPNVENLTVYHKIAYLLYHRYIGDEAELQINISFRIRKRIHNHFKKYENRKKDEIYSYRELFEVFDSAMQEVLSLLKDSETRFMETMPFKKMKKSTMKE